MTLIDYKRYLSVNDFARQNSVNNTFLIYKDELKIAALRIGYFSNGPTGIKAAEYYLSSIDLIFDDNLCATDEYLNSESSIKVALSFLAGMATAIVVADKEYNVDLYHLKDPIVRAFNNTRKNGKHPDFVGFSRFPNRKPEYLFEAKGGINKLSSGDGGALNAVEQLKSVDIIYGLNAYPNHSLKKI